LKTNYSKLNKEEKRELVLNYNLSKTDKEIVIFKEIAETTIDIMYEKYSGKKLRRKKRYVPKYKEHNQY
jgi:hypothetical protein